WHVEAGQAVRRDDNLVDIETEKVVLEVPAPRDGIITEILRAEGDTVLGDDVIALFEAGAEAVAEAGTPAAREDSAEETIANEPFQESQAAGSVPSPGSDETPPATTSSSPAGPAVKYLAAVDGIDLQEIQGTGRGGRILKSDVHAHAVQSSTQEVTIGQVGVRREPMSRLRKTIASRLMQAQHNAAILTTFNEVDLYEVKALRARYRETFEKAHGVRLGFMSFFVKAGVEALKRFPIINAAIEDTDILYHDYYDIGIAVSSPRGLVVPVLRDAERLGLAEIEKSIAALGERAKSGALTLDDLTGGTFTITNGGVFGSMLSTPILNPPQSAILGMHKIQDRPVALDGAIVIRPMMYLALSYDHRIIDGADAVAFLVAIKEALEDPARLLLEI
ncbi:MAG: 2-oxoglutarate dehydrogenase complex dihydrolipoyllysine-residue succinyltransferase, partial [Proteobacteria bacterium]|nr:2-oxoglutarate dehydrogenase complex dihydrolipoyllysine-residue succinyltransferase [Pseudomonadota bacterium]